MEELFVVGDIHAERRKAETLLTQWNPDRQRLVLLGDLIDRGEDALGTILLAINLKEKYGAKIVQGNHDALLLAWLNEPEVEKELYYPQGGMETIHSFFDRKITFTHTATYIAGLMQKQFEEEINFLKNLPLYYEHGKYVCVHAGVNLAYQDWKYTSDNDFLWIRTPFHYGRNDTGKTFIFGHTPTPKLNSDKGCQVWISPCGTKYGIDGGAVFGGLLHGLVVNDEGVKDVVSVDRQLKLHSGLIAV